MQNNNHKPVNLRTRYKQTLELSFILTLLILCSLFFAFQKNTSSFKLPDVKIDDKTIEVIPPTIQKPPKPPEPVRPTVFIQDDDAPELEGDELVNIFDFNPTTEIGPPPETDLDIEHEFWAVSIKPVLKYKAIPYYPEIARKAGIQGKVVILVVIAEDGSVIRTSFISGNEMLKDSAIAAAKKCTFSPAMQRDKYVKVKMIIPFEFRLN